MNIKELRIGNMVQLTDKWFADNPELYNTPKVFTIEYFGYDHLSKEHYVNGYHVDYIEGVLLTKEILQNHDFEKREGNNICWDLGDFMIGWYGNDFATWVVEIKQYHHVTKFHSQIKHLHQLQNLYFELTKEELSYEQTN